MKRLALAASVLLFMSAGNAMAQIHHWPATDPDPYFKTRVGQTYAPTNHLYYPRRIWTDISVPYLGNGEESNRAFWAYQSRYQN
jgi:hypothetical protein